MRRTSINNKGMSSILFAMTFAIILSLLAIGFATLVRDDQREVLDQTLGYQAQYAAESAINQVQAAIKGGQISGESSNCNELGLSDIVSASCVKWTDISNEAVFSSVTENRGPKSFKMMTDGSGSFTGLVVSWSNASGGPYSVAGRTLPNPISNTNKSIIKIAMLDTGGSIFTQFYLVPDSSNDGSVSIASSNGQVYRTPCAIGATCSVTLNFGGINFVDGFFAVSAIGNVADTVKIEAVGTNFKGVQYTVDATAIANDITKRIEARVNPETSTWRPGVAVSANHICKDIKIDGSNTASISGGAVCP